MNMMYNKNIKKAHAGHTRNRRECTMKSKKLAALGLTAVLSLGLLTACSGGSDDKIGRASCRERVSSPV